VAKKQDTAEEQGRKLDELEQLWTDVPDDLRERCKNIMLRLLRFLIRIHRCAGLIWPDKEQEFMIERLNYAEGVVDICRQEILGQMQGTFKDLADFQKSRAKSPSINKEIARRAYKLATNAGCQIFSNGKPAYLRWHKGVYEVLTTSSARKRIISGVRFPRLEIRLRGATKS
jgi:hypothetical protein